MHIDCHSTTCAISWHLTLFIGGLVKKILESKKEYAQSEQQQSQTKTKIDKSSMNDATRHKEKEMVKKEVRIDQYYAVSRCQRSIRFAALLLRGQVWANE